MSSVSGGIPSNIAPIRSSGGRYFAARYCGRVRATLAASSAGSRRITNATTGRSMSSGFALAAIGERGSACRISLYGLLRARPRARARRLAHRVGVRIRCRLPYRARCPTARARRLPRRPRDRRRPRARRPARRRVPLPGPQLRRPKGRPRRRTIRALARNGASRSRTTTAARARGERARPRYSRPRASPVRPGRGRVRGILATPTSCRRRSSPPARADFYPRPRRCCRHRGRTTRPGPRGRRGRLAGARG